MAKNLIDYYTPQLFSNEEQQALTQWASSDDMAMQVNSILAATKAGIVPRLVKNQGVQQLLPIMDMAMKRVPVPMDLVAYIPLSSDIKSPMILFKGYQSSTLDPSQISTASAFIQLIIPKGSGGVYLDDFSPTPGLAEFLLPRATGIKIVTGPKKVSQDQWAYNAVML